MVSQIYTSLVVTSMCTTLIPPNLFRTTSQLWLVIHTDLRADILCLPQHRQRDSESHSKQMLGAVVRIITNECTIDDPGAVNIIYRTSSQLMDVGVSFFCGKFSLSNLANVWNNSQPGECQQMNRTYSPSRIYLVRQNIPGRSLKYALRQS